MARTDVTYPADVSKASTWGRFQRIVAPCSDCGDIGPIIGHWGPTQERQLCLSCDDNAWSELMLEVFGDR